MQDDFQIFIKPAGASCNLGCKYCYYLDKARLYEDMGSLKMGEALLEEYIRQHIEASSEQTVFFSWHGGEPLLAGIGFYKKAVELQKKHLPSGRSALNGIQTNGTLLSDDWCRFFRDENFVIGISIDGPEEYHNRYRLNKSGEPVFNEVMNGYGILRKYGIRNEILCVVNSSNGDHPTEIYKYFREIGAEYITFLPLAVRDINTPSGVTGESVSPGQWGSFLTAVFDMWIENDIGRIKIQIIEEALRSAFSREHTLCIFKKECGRVPVIEHNGDFYSCDHFVDEEHLIGNIKEKPLTELLNHPLQVAFGHAKSVTLPAYCLECEVLSMCNGECPKNRFAATPDGEPGLNYLCPGYKQFFNHCKPFIEVLKKIRYR